ncbi:MAG: WYL domain-containing protein [Myxococcales bacterium]|nr:WYL domain-containing protein [Myxococcales bacterium]
MPRGRQVVRQWRVLRILESSRGGLTVAELAARFADEATERSVRRDLDDLQEAGFALLRSEDSRWSAKVPEGWPYSVPVTASEVLSLLLAADVLAPIDGAELADGLRSLTQKLAPTLPPAAAGFVEELRQCQMAGFSLPGSLDGLGPQLQSVEQAIAKEQRLRIAYRDYEGRQSQRTVEPYVLWFMDGQLYVIAHCLLRRDFRCFVLTRIVQAELLEASFERDPDFDPRAHAEAGVGVYSGLRHDIVLRFLPDAAHLAGERRFHASQEVHDQPDGSALLTMRAAGLAVVAQWVAGMGGRVCAEAPAELTQMVRDIHRAGIAAHGAKGLAPVRDGASQGRDREAG